MKNCLLSSGTVQPSESMLTISFLSLSGGLQDAYTYIERAGVFANAQTGNIVLLSANILEGNRGKILHYLIPLIFFSLGVMAAEMIRTHFREDGRLSWQQAVLVCEICLLFTVGLLPSGITVLANAIVSFACAMQVQTFRKIEGCSFSSTMCIGDLRSGVEALYSWHSTKNREALRKAVRYFGVILFFAAGAGIGAFGVPYLGVHTIWASCALLTICFILMFFRRDTGK